MSTILLNGREIEFSTAQLPCIIHGTEGAGSSLFTIRLLANLFAKGNKIIFLSGYRMARDEFCKLSRATPDSDNVIFITRENGMQLADLSKTLADFDERIILIKNFELYDRAVLEAVLGKQKLIVSGNLDNCTYASDLLSHKWTTKISFSQSNGAFIDVPVDLPKYSGYLESGDTHGFVSMSE